MDWEGAKREAASRGLQLKPALGLAHGELDRAAACLADTLQGMKGTPPAATSASASVRSSWDSPPAPLWRLARQLDDLIRAKGPPIDTQALLALGSLTSALGAQLRQQPQYLRSCRSGGTTTNAREPSTPVTPSHLLRASTPARGCPSQEFDVELPNTIASPSKEEAPPLQQGRDTSLHDWALQALRALIESSPGEMAAHSSLLNALWHVCPGDTAAWQAMLLAASTSPSRPALATPILDSLLSGAARTGDGDARAASPSSGGGPPWRRPSRVHPDCAPPSDAAPSNSLFTAEAELGAELSAAVQTVATNAYRWSTLLGSLPEVALPPEFQAIVTAPAAALLQQLLHVLTALPQGHPAASSIAAAADACLRMPSQITASHTGGAGSGGSEGMLAAYHWRCGAAGLSGEATEWRASVSAAVAERGAARWRQALLSPRGDGILDQPAARVPDAIWPPTGGGEDPSGSLEPLRPRKMMSNVAAALVAVLDMCREPEVDLPICMHLPAVVAAIEALYGVLQHLQSMCRAAARRGATRLQRLLLVSSAECCHGVCSTAARQAWQQVIASCTSGLTTECFVRGLAAAAEVESQQMAVAARQLLVSSETGLLCTVVLAESDSSPWQSFRAPLSMKDCAGPGTRLWAAQLWQLMADAGGVLSLDAFEEVVCKVLGHSLSALQDRYLRLSPSTMAWRDRFCGDTYLMCSTGMGLCLSVAASGTTHDGTAPSSTILRSRVSAASREASTLCCQLLTHSGLLSCPAELLASRFQEPHAMDEPLEVRR